MILRHNNWSTVFYKKCCWLGGRRNGMLEVCCGLTHPWDTYQVESRWLPDSLKCLIIGENPGSPDSEYFYQVPKDHFTDPVVVRRAILQGLFQATLISAPTLDGFREGGFIFDHAIRCQPPSDIVKAERLTCS